MNDNLLSDKWLKAAVIGGLWASIEIVLGSFLHNLRIPFAGTILATQGILLLVAFNQVWKESGIIIRAGIITALMKSISPSSVILGPMIGIFMEAALLELFLIIFRKGLIGAIIASAIALSSALLHKVLSIIILYGLNIVKIYENIYIYFQKIFKSDLLSPIEFILLILFVYLFFGAISGIMGVYIGKKVNMILPNASLSDVEFSGSELFPLSSNQKFNMYLLTFNILLIPLGLILINNNLFETGLPFLIIFTSYTYWRYTAIFRRLKKPIFWVQLILIIILSGLFYSTESDTEALFKLEGIYFGLEMSFRALFIVVVFTAISIELRNPIIKKFLYANHLGALHGSLSLAFNSLPIIIKSLPPVKQFFKQPLTTLSQLIATNIQWYSIFKNQTQKDLS
ncbi:MAG: hypothetical protein PF484_11565 [Bacteroidales bacterium]|jgi:hypothetical protein|nr:hypothetical protein [Bacteroidales bacterium]